MMVVVEALFLFCFFLLLTMVMVASRLRADGGLHWSIASFFLLC